MQKVGVIAEYNPFHNGHIYHLNKVKEIFPDASLILVLAGNFTQRGDVSIINKWDKTKLALDYGFDLVVELPFNVATSSANYYAKGAIDILNKLNCDYLVFGSETNDVELFKKLVNITKDNKVYENKIKYIYYLKGNPIKLENPIPLGNSNPQSTRSPRYTTLKKLKTAKVYADLA